MIGRPYHSDPGLNHGVLEEFQVLGYPILSMRSIPKDPAWLDRFFESDIKAGRIETPLEVQDVWPENYSPTRCRRCGAAKFAARHPNVVVLDLSSFKCGTTRPTYGLIDSIIAASATPYSALHDIDANKAGRVDQDPGQDLRTLAEAARERPGRTRRTGKTSSSTGWKEAPAAPRAQAPAARGAQAAGSALEAMINERRRRWPRTREGRGQQAQGQPRRTGQGRGLVRLGIKKRVRTTAKSWRAFRRQPEAINVETVDSKQTKSRNVHEASDPR
jgi:hypothetical protein